MRVQTLSRAPLTARRSTTTRCISITGVSSKQGLVASPYRRGVLAIALLVLVWRAFTVSRWSWQDDDWVYMDGTRTMGLWSYMWQNYNGHLMPAEFLVNWLVTKAAPLDFTVPIALVAVSSAALTILWGLAFERIAGPRLVLLAPVALVSLSPLLLRPTLWWASALQVIPLQVFLAILVLLAVRAARETRAGDGVRLALVLLAALLFWQKALLLTIVLAFVLLHASSGSVRQRVRSAWPLVWPSALVAAAYLPLFIWRTSHKSGANQLEFDVTQVTARGALEFAGRGVSEILVPALFGGPWGTLPVDSDLWIHQPLYLSVAFGLLGAALAVLLVTRVHHGWMLLAMVVLYAAAAWGLILFSSRFLLSGQATVTTERFSVDVLAVVVVAAVLAWASPRTEGRTGVSPRGAPLILLPLLAGSIVLANAWHVSRIGVSATRAWVDTVTAELDRKDGVVLWDGNAPDNVMPAFWLENSHLSRMLAVRRDVTFSGSGGEMYGVSPVGKLTPVTLSPVSDSEPGPVPDCGWTIQPGETISVPMTAPAFDWTWGVRIDTFAAVGGPLTVSFGDASVDVDVVPGLNSSFGVLVGDVGDSATLSLPPGAGTLCLNSLVVGNVVFSSPDAE